MYLNKYLFTLIILGITHAVIDGICMGTYLHISKIESLDKYYIFQLGVLYNTIAFGSQPFIGLISDRLKSPRLISIIGAILTGIGGLIYQVNPLSSIILLGIGNSSFHIGGGSISLNITPQKATAPGIFVSLGALGLSIGALLEKNIQLPISPLLFFLFLLVITIAYLKIPALNYNCEMKEAKKNFSALIILLLFLAIMIRSLVGSVAIFPWKSEASFAYLFTFAIVLGKALGGILADKFGFSKTAVLALIFSIPMISLWNQNPLFGILGMLLFNIPMPITLVGISNVLRGRPGFAFGLTCLAILIGGFLPIFTYKDFFSQSVVISISIIVSVVSIFYAFRHYNKL